MGLKHDIALPTADVRLADGRFLALRSNPMRHWYDRKTRLTVVAELEPFDANVAVPQLHVSLSYPDHLPSWRDLKLVKQAFFGDDRTAVIVLPPAVEYVNLHEHCHHLWEWSP